MASKACLSDMPEFLPKPFQITCEVVYIIFDMIKFHVMAVCRLFSHGLPHELNLLRSFSLCWQYMLCGS